MGRSEQTGTNNGHCVFNPDADSACTNVGTTQICVWHFECVWTPADDEGKPAKCGSGPIDGTLERIKFHKP